MTFVEPGTIAHAERCEGARPVREDDPCHSSTDEEGPVPDPFRGAATAQSRDPLRAPRTPRCNAGRVPVDYNRTGEPGGAFPPVTGLATRGFVRVPRPAADGSYHSGASERRGAADGSSGAWPRTRGSSGRLAGRTGGLDVCQPGATIDGRGLRSKAGSTITLGSQVRHCGSFADAETGRAVEAPTGVPGISRGTASSRPASLGLPASHGAGGRKLTSSPVIGDQERTRRSTSGRGAAARSTGGVRPPGDRAVRG
jgi:hypothetical protein